MLTLLLVSLALADSWGPYDAGFVVDPRVDVPTDARLLYGANFESQAEVVAGPGAPFLLDQQLVTGVGARPLLAIDPPDGGWEPGAAYTVAVAGYYDDTDGDELSFTVAGAPADPPAGFEVTSVDFGAWSEEETYFAWGCCKRIRTVQVTVEVPEADPWSYVEIVGDFEGPSQITTQEIHEHLDFAVGAGTHSLRFVQWLEDDDEPEPYCFDVVAVSAAGVAGEPETFCEGDAVPGEGEGCGGCAVGGSPVRGGLALVPLLAVVLRRRSRATDDGADPSAPSGERGER